MIRRDKTSTSWDKNWVGKIILRLLSYGKEGDYGFAILGAALINIALFAFMPALIQRIPEKPALETIENVQVVRMKRPETEVRKKESVPPEPEKKDIIRDRKPLSISKPMQQKLHLPFQLNPKLAAGPQTFSVPPLEMIALQGPELKGAYAVHELDAPVTPLVRIPPVYPMRAKRMGIQGWVKIQFLINTDGNVAHVEILAAEPADCFETAVINCVSRWRFKAGTVAGTPVNTWVETTIRFELED